MLSWVSPFKGIHDNQTVIQSDCNKQLIALFPKDDKNLVLYI